MNGRRVAAWLVFGAAFNAALLLLSWSSAQGHHANMTTLAGIFVLAYAFFALIVAVMQESSRQEARPVNGTELDQKLRGRRLQTVDVAGPWAPGDEINLRILTPAAIIRVIQAPDTVEVSAEPFEDWTGGFCRIIRK
jgi:hypothetical protein